MNGWRNLAGTEGRAQFTFDISHGACHGDNENI